jgi:hypothetical protein
VFISENGWMTSEIFVSWFHTFLRHVKERPLLVILDGHKTHVSLEVIKYAKDNNVSLLKLPSHLTHQLQPLDKTCFKALKSIWDQRLVSYQRENNFRNIGKSESVDLLCEVWHKGLTEANVCSGFRETGIFPVDRTKYSRQLLKRNEDTGNDAQQQHDPVSPPTAGCSFVSPSNGEPGHSSSQRNCCSHVSSGNEAGPSSGLSPTDRLHEVCFNNSKAFLND